MGDLKLKLSGLAFVLFFCIPQEQTAQTVTKPKAQPEYKVNVLDNKAVNIEFETEKVVSNILIIIVDNSGNTLYLDNQHDFKGTYKCTIDLSMYNKGDYFIKIKSDGEETEKKLSIK